MPNARRVLLTIGGALLFAAWPVLVHLSVSAAQLPLAAVLLVIVVALLASSVVQLSLVVVSTGLVALAILGSLRPDWLVRASPVLIYLMLAWLFGSTLRPGAKPMVSRFAELEQGRLFPELAQYTRRLTWVWTGFFLVMAAVSVALTAAPIAAWSLFTNLVSYALVAALFLGEFAWRHHRFPELEHASPLTLLQLIRRSGALTRHPPERS